VPAVPATRLSGADARADRLERLLVELWGRIRIDWGFAATRLPQVVRQERWLAGDERRLLLETLYGMVRHSRRLEFALESASTRLPPGRIRELSQLLAYRVLTKDLTTEAAHARLPEVDWGMVASVDARIEHERQAGRRLGLAHSLPDWLAVNLLEQYGEQAPALAAALNERAPLVLRANTLKGSREDLARAIAAEGAASEPTPVARHGLRLAERVDVFGLEAYRQGLFEVQDEGSQLIAELVEPPAKGVVLDACAGSGGKTLALAAAMEGKGRLLAVDVDARKLEDLKKRARRAGISSVQALHAEHDTWPHDVAALTHRVDRVLVDAPCTGTGSLRRNPELRWRIDGDDLGAFSSQQEAIARRSLELLAAGGRLIYATCSLLRQENEAVVERLLAGARDLDLVPVSQLLGTERARRVTDPSGRFLRTLPHTNDMDGFFAAVIQRKA
jgi:16S rRNA (cytosine967-C5)-methyltransferase